MSEQDQPPPTGPVYGEQQPGQQQPGYQQPGYQQPGYQQPGYPGLSYGAPLPPLAHWGLRVGGALLDGLMVLPGLVVAMIGLAFQNPDGTPSGLSILFLLIGYAAMFVFGLWNQVFRQGGTGWSIGKQVVGIRLLSERTMQPLGPGLTFVRQLAHFLDTIACYIGWLWPLWDQKKQTFADKIMTSVVVVQKRPS